VGTKLPSIRLLSQNLNLSKTTIENSYQQLLSEGYIESRPRSGLYVCKLEEDFLTKNISTTIIDKIKSPNVEIKYKYDFDPNATDLYNFPFSVWKKLTFECLTPTRNDLFKYDETKGSINLRNKLSTYLRHSRSVQCNENQIIIGSTIQQLVSVVCQLIPHNKIIVALEDPGCVEMKSIFRNLGFEIVAIPLENDGINIEKLKESGAKILYTTPSKQFPCGMVMPISKRLKLLKWAENENAIILEGDYDGEYRYQGNPIPSLQGLSNSNNVIYLSTFSKYILPSICISYMVLPLRLLNIYNQEYRLYEQSVSRLNQEILYQFMYNGYFERHIRKTRNLYSKKHSLMINAINEYLNGIITVIGKDAGLHILIEVNNGMNENELVESAENLGIKIYPYSFYLFNKSNYVYPKILLGFGGLSPDNIISAIKLLKEAWIKKS
ncbi:MAG: PLP-dependent aminotransferase family protein, partial [Clostridium sp.]